MLDTQLMESLIENRAEVKKVLPTAFHVRVIGFVKSKGYVSTKCTADHFRISAYSARMHLKALLNKGYLTRELIGEQKHIYSYAL